MRVNVEKVLERDQKLSELDNRAGTYTCFHNIIISKSKYYLFLFCIILLFGNLTIFKMILL